MLFTDSAACGVGLVCACGPQSSCQSSLAPSSANATGPSGPLCYGNCGSLCIWRAPSLPPLHRQILSLRHPAPLRQMRICGLSSWFSVMSWWGWGSTCPPFRSGPAQPSPPQALGALSRGARHQTSSAGGQGAGVSSGPSVRKAGAMCVLTY